MPGERRPAAPSRYHLRVRQGLAAFAIAAIVLATPLSWRAAVGRDGDPEAPSYLPSLESRRARGPFDPAPIEDLRRMNPAYVVIGDSMAGRIDPDHLAALSGGAVAPLLYAASGPAYWYLALKNWVAPSGVRPEWVFIFFRDTNLTDVTFRLDGAYRYQLDQVALDAEPALDAVIARRFEGSWRGIRAWLDDTYAVSRVRRLVEPAVTTWPARAVGGNRADALIDRTNQMFALEHQRSTAQADVAATEAADADFDRFVDASVLPLMFDIAEAHRLRLGFVRVLRRPEHGQPPPETPALTEYVADLRAYIQRRGGHLFDDRADPAFAALPYSDGDHVGRAGRVPYTDLFWARLQRSMP
jgi:hypothetical protein